MKSAKVYRSLHQIIAGYRAKLAITDEERFAITPPIGGWSYSEVYSHIFDASLLSLLALQKAAMGEGKESPTHFAVKLILFFGSLPPGKKYKVPKQLEERVKKISKLEAEEFITAFEIKLAELYPTLEQADPKSKTKHPRMGYLNAAHWLRFIEVHLKHHLKQLQRIEKSFQ
jgi:hypothetical protein